MKRLFSFLLLFVQLAIADEVSIQPYLLGGYGQENFEWKMDNTEEVTDVFTIAKWKNIHTAGFQLGVKAYPFEAVWGEWASWWFDLHADWCFNVRRENFHGVFRDVELFGPTLAIDAGRNSYRAGDFVIGIGYDFYVVPCLSFAHVLGFSAKGQHLRNHSGKVDIPESLQDEIASLSLHDFRYHAAWRDFWTGLQLDWRATPCLGVTLAGNYHLGRLYAHGRWRLTETLTDGLDVENKDKVHQGGVYQGVTAKAQADYAIPCSCWLLTVECSYRYFIKTRGVDKTKTKEIISLPDGVVISEGYNELKNPYRVSTQAFVVAAGVKYDF